MHNVGLPLLGKPPKGRNNLGQATSTQWNILSLPKNTFCPVGALIDVDSRGVDR